MIDLVAALWNEQGGLCVCRRAEATPLRLVDDGMVVSLLCAHCASQVRTRPDVRAERRLERFTLAYTRRSSVERDARDEQERGPRW